MVSRRASRIAAVLVTLGLIAPVGAWAGLHGRHGYYGDYGHYSSPRFYDQSGQLQRPVGYVEDLGALDLNVRPKNTQVYLNGDYIGVTGEFDGSPDHLWLEEGTYELIFHNEVTVVREFEIHAGAVIDVKLRLVPGQSVPPQDLISEASVADEPN